MTGKEPATSHKGKSAAKDEIAGLTKTRDPDLANYFVVRSTTPDSESLSPKFTNDKLLPPRGRPRSHKSDSSRGPRKRGKSKSAASSASGQTKAQYITKWNEESLGTDLMSSSWDLNHDMRHPADPPRPPKEGYEWVWFPQGYWAERELARLSIPVPSSSKQTSRTKWWSRTPDPQDLIAATTDPSRTDRSRSDRSPGKPLAKPITPRFEIPKIRIGSISRKSSAADSKGRRSSSHKSLPSLQLGGFAFIKQKSDETDATQGEKPLGLYCRTKKNIREILLERSKLAYEESAIPRAPGLKSRTTVLLEGTSQYLDDKERERNERTLAGFATPKSVASYVTLDSRLRRGFGLAPWHRKSSRDSIMSATSSIRGLLMGRNPAATPLTDDQYVAANGEVFQKVDIASLDPRQPTCLPSEARRINTPPMEPGTPTRQARGFFFDLGSAREGSTGPASDNEHSGNGCSGNGCQSRHSGVSGEHKAKSKAISSTQSSLLADRPSSHKSVEWWEADTVHSSTGNKSTDNKIKANINPKSAMQELDMDLERARAFVLEIPDHLPSSPMCPKHPLHKSGGKGICPTHGRRKSVPLKKLERIDTEI